MVLMAKLGSSTGVLELSRIKRTKLTLLILEQHGLTSMEPAAQNTRSSNMTVNT